MWAKIIFGSVLASAFLPAISLNSCAVSVPNPDPIEPDWICLYKVGSLTPNWRIDGNTFESFGITGIPLTGYWFVFYHDGRDICRMNEGGSSSHRDYNKKVLQEHGKIDLGPL